MTRMVVYKLIGEKPWSEIVPYKVLKMFLCSKLGQFQKKTIYKLKSREGIEKKRNGSIIEEVGLL